MKKHQGSEGTAKKLSKKKLASLIKVFREGDNFAREKAMEALLASPDKSVLEAVAPLLQEKDTSMRMMILEILKKIGDLNIDTVTALLDDENEDIRVYACEVLADLRHPEAIPHLVRKTRSDYDNVRNAACISLAEFDDDRAVDALLESLKDVNWIAFSAILGLGKIGNEKAVPALLNVFRNGSEELSLAACEALMDFRNPEILDSMIETLREWDEKKRDEYIKVMLEKGEEDIFLRMKERISGELFEHLLASVRYENKRSLKMMRLLVHFKTPATCETILDALVSLDPDGAEHGEVLSLLAGLNEVWADKIVDYAAKSEESLGPLINACVMGRVKIKEETMHEIFRSASAEVRRLIIGNIRDIVMGTGCEIVREAIHDADGHVLGDAVVAAGSMGMTELKEEVKEIAQKSFPDVRTKAMKALACLDKVEAMALAERFVNEGTSDDKKIFLAAASILDKEKSFILLSELLRDNDEGIRKAAIGAVGNFLDDERFMNILKSLLKNEEIPHEALKIVKEKKLTIFRDRLISLFEDENRGAWTRYYALSALDSFRDHTLFDLFIRGLKDENNLLKIGSMKALGDLEDPRALVSIAPFTESDDEDIRSTAEFTISRLENL
jgi:HEAT repeat protein